MKEIAIEEIKRIELDMLRFLDRVCQENRLRYYLCGGTLLGAVRHKGFIPWDDDIDVLMPRPDYEKLIDVLEGDPRYRLLSAKDQGYYYNFGKLVDRTTGLRELKDKPIRGMGVYLDIFPLDGMPEEESAQLAQYQKLDRQRHRITEFSRIPIPRKNVFCIFRDACKYAAHLFMSQPKAQQAYRDAALAFGYEDSAYVLATGGSYKTKDIFPKSWFAETARLEFEGELFAAPVEYEAYLRQLYGDYMQLPPVEKRVTHHTFTAWYQ